MIVLIPAYEPDRRLVRLVEQLRGAAPDLHVVVVDDGSGPSHAAVFDDVRTRGATVLTLPVNRGKGAALKVGFAHVVERHPGREVVCADCDGQHSVVDVLRVAERVRSAEAAMVLGVRAFTGPVPWRSTIGNSVTRALVGAVSGLRLRDTQTGLRGYPPSVLPWLLEVPGDRFEYELSLLLRAAAEGLRIEELEIATIYLDGNASSHFRPLADSARVYAPLLAPLVRFAGSSLLAFGVDAGALLALHALTGSLGWSVLGARALSSAVNFLTNRRLVFPGGRRRTLRAAALGYYGLAAGMLAAGYAGLRVLTGAGVPLLAAKAITDVVLFAVGFHLQRTVVFRVRSSSAVEVAAPSGATPGAPPAAAALRAVTPSGTAAQGATPRVAAPPEGRRPAWPAQRARR